jgi:nitrite reductase/ring-hydroxylating ferredoxin subunit
MTRPALSPTCSGCDADPSRRAFLSDIAAIAAGVAGALQLNPARAAALSVELASARSATGEEVTYAIPAQDGVTIDKAREAILVRHEQSVYAFALSCPHQKTSLRWQEAERRFQCPKHKSTFRPDGAFVDGRATRNMDRYGIRRDGDDVAVDLGKLYREDENRSDWISAVVQL